VDCWYRGGFEVAGLKVAVWPTLRELALFLNSHDFRNWGPKEIERRFALSVPEYQGRCAELVSKSISMFMSKCLWMNANDEFHAAIADIHCLSKSVLYTSFYFDDHTNLNIGLTNLREIPGFLWKCEKEGIRIYENPKWVLKNYSFLTNHYLNWLRLKTTSITNVRPSYNYVKVYYLMKRLGFGVIPLELVRCYDVRVLIAYCLLWERYCVRDIHSSAQLLSESLKDLPLRRYMEVVRLSSPLFE